MAEPEIIEALYVAIEDSPEGERIYCIWSESLRAWLPQVTGDKKALLSMLPMHRRAKKNVRIVAFNRGRTIAASTDEASDA